MVVDPLALTMMDNSELRRRLQERDAEIERLKADQEQGVRDYLALMGRHDRSLLLLREVVTRLLACPAIADEGHGDPQWGCAETREAEAFARAALAALAVLAPEDKT